MDESPSDRQVRALRCMLEARGINPERVRGHHLADLAMVLTRIYAETQAEERREAGKAA
ncbi:MAG TPA: hypothetical protein VFU97_24300 [Xanthobacteraceae bacterium]|nr:hypothetical protein [Xanthobacteraceae bacterium]